jgi:hypothetical protein
VSENVRSLKLEEGGIIKSIVVWEWLAEASNDLSTMVGVGFADDLHSSPARARRTPKAHAPDTAD